MTDWFIIRLDVWYVRCALQIPLFHLSVTVIFKLQSIYMYNIFFYIQDQPSYINTKKITKQITTTTPITKKQRKVAWNQTPEPNVMSNIKSLKIHNSNHALCIKYSFQPRIYLNSRVFKCFMYSYLKYMELIFALFQFMNLYYFSIFILVKIWF